MSTCAILLCAGRGERLGAGVPKALAPLAGRPLFAWALEAFQRCPAVEGIVLVGPVRTLRELVAASGMSSDKIVGYSEGGDARQHSVARGLHVVPESFTHVAVHDSARALVSPEVIARAVAAAVEHGAAIAAVPQADTLKQGTLGTITGTVPRAGLWAAQTPQVFRRDWLERAHREAAEVATDDATLVEWLGHPVHLAPGDPLNFKVTTAADLELAEAWLAHKRGSGPEGRGMMQRVGLGYDVHRVKAGRPLVLGGVRFESDWGLVGHSDADVVSHAVGDALLGAAGLGDLGEHFPPGDPQWKDASSLDLLARIAALLKQHGARALNVDAMVVAESPKLAPHRAEMCANIARSLGVSPSCVSVKATTNETLGAIGRREGLAAMAVAMVERS